MNKYRIYMDGKTYEMEIELVNEKERNTERVQDFPNVTYKNTDSTVRVVSPDVEYHTRFDDKTVLSPMSGIVTKIFSKVGDTLKKNDIVLVLEAMKMENEIYAPRSGLLKEIFVKEGQTIANDIPLFEMESED